jgi:drug/metabolite transporter (DMT)-like permease
MTTPAITSSRALSSAQDATDQAHKQRRFWIIASLLSVYIIWSTTYLAIRVALVSFPPQLMMGIRFVMAGGGLLIFLRLRGSALPTPKQWRNALIVGGLMFGGGMGSVAIAEVLISSGLTATLVAIVPLWAIVISMFFGHRPKATEWFGVALGIVGVGVLTLEGNLQANPGDIGLMLFATLCWSLGSVVSKHLEMPQGAMANAAEMLAGGLLLVVLGLLRGEQIVGTPTIGALLAVAYLTTFGSLATITAYMYLLKTVRPALATSYALVNPAIALLLGVLLGGEHLTGSAFIALPLILVGIAFVALQRQEKPIEDSPQEA